MIVTSSNAKSFQFVHRHGATYRVTKGVWRDGVVDVEVESSQYSCDDLQHSLEVMHHYEDNNGHLCPTGFLMCRVCTGIALEPAPYTCTIWRESETLPDASDASQTGGAT